VIVLETTFLVDYLEGVDATREFLEDHVDSPLFTTTLSLFEVYRGGARADGQSGLERVADGLDWLWPLPLDERTARESALVEAELLEVGAPINLRDVVIAGICRRHDGQLVTRDRHFGTVPDLEVVTY